MAQFGAIKQFTDEKRANAATHKYSNSPEIIDTTLLMAAVLCLIAALLAVWL